MTNLAWLPARWSHVKRRGDKAPQRQCPARGPHAAHSFEDDGGLTWSCQGRGGAS